MRGTHIEDMQSSLKLILTIMRVKITIPFYAQSILIIIFNNNCKVIIMMAQKKELIEQGIQQIYRNGRYQKLLIAFMASASLLATFMYMTGPFNFMNPIFVCNHIETSQQQACKIIDECSISNNFTAAFYCDLFCDRQTIRSVIQSAEYIGYALSMFLLVPLSDSRGRRFTFILGLLIQTIGISILLIGVYSKMWVIIFIGQLLLGASSGVISMLSYIITSQFCNQILYQKSVMLYCSMWGLGEMCFFLFYYFLNQWYNYMIFMCLIPSIAILIISLFFLLQPPQFSLFMATNHQQFNQTIDYLSLYNNVKSQDISALKQLGDNFISQSKKSNQNFNNAVFQSLRSLFRDRKNVTSCICLALPLATFNIFYYGMQGSMERIGFNFGVSMLLAGIHQFIGYLLTSLVVHKISRKIGFSCSAVLSSMLGLSLLLPFIKNNQIWESIVVSGIRLCTVFSYSFHTILMTETFDSKIKSTGIGFTQGLSLPSQIIVPFLIIKMNNLQIHPLVGSSAIFLIFGVLPLIWVKQTVKNKEKQDKKQGTYNESLISQTTSLEQVS